jgi:uncharacterized BrkB/YihY/UPF0761 family membrane protein
MGDDINISLFYITLYITTLGIIVEAAYQKIKPLFRKDEAKEIKWENEVLPLVIGLLLVIAFLPTSIFGWLPFHPQWPWLDVLLTSLIISRGANLSHETYKSFADFIGSLIGRIAQRF